MDDAIGIEIAGIRQTNHVQAVSMAAPGADAPGAEEGGATGRTTVALQIRVTIFRYLEIVHGRQGLAHGKVLIV